MLHNQFILRYRFQEMFMTAMNPSHALLFLLLIFSFKLKTTISCPEIEKQSLLSFKQSLEDPDNALSSWDREVNCCKWKGVFCSNLTGHVDKLRIQEYLSGKVDQSLGNLKHLRYLDLSQNFFKGTIPSFIGSFTNLEYLNLSRAGFRGKIPHTLGNLTHLHTLDLAGRPSGFFEIFIKLSSDRLEWLSGLSKLEYLNLNYAYLNSSTPLVQVINTLPSLLQLHLKSCSLEFQESLDPVIMNITSLKFLDLSENAFNSRFLTVPTWIFELNNLLHLDISYNSLEGPIPSISNATKLHYIDLSNNNFNYSIPDWIYSCKDLVFLALGGNDLQGTIHNAIGNLTSLAVLDLMAGRLSGKVPREIFNLCKLKRLDLSYNELQGKISGNMCFLQTLEVLSLSQNQLSGVIPTSLGKLLALETLILDGNKFIGNLPESFGQLSNLNKVLIGDNMLEGVMSEAHFANLTKLQEFNASGNHLTLKVAENWIPPFQLQTLELRSWNLGPSSESMSWIETQKEVLKILDLSDTGISGNVSGWMWDLQLLYLNLSHNHLHGNIPYILSSYTFLSSNNFSGSLPLVTSSVLKLDLLDNSFSGGLSKFFCNSNTTTLPYFALETLHLGGNELSGELPDCWMKWTSLQYLNLGDNKLHGSIPTSLWYLPDLMSLNLYGNNLSGQIPSSLQNCTGLRKLDLSNNHLHGSILTWIGSQLNLRFLILRRNKFSGEIPSEICHLNSLQILDLSHNTFSGIIPSCVDNLTAMSTKKMLYDMQDFSGWGKLMESASIATKGRVFLYDTILDLVTSIDLSRNNLSGDIPKDLTSLVELRTLNLSQNHLTGSIPEKIGDMRQLESLDFSRNSLSGQIPITITLISSLSYLNLSYNNFTGKVPQGTQLQGFNASSFIGNNLCGPPLSNCSHDHDSDQVSGHKEEDDKRDESHEIEWKYVFISSGYAVGISTVVTVLMLNKSWREAYFGLLASMWDKLYVFVLVHRRKLYRS